MATLREIKLRIKSIKSTQKITKAMEMVAASKMRKAQNMALKGRPYIQKLTEIIAHLINSSEPKLQHPLILKREKTKSSGYLLISSNRGLCGAFNSSLNKVALEKMLAEKNLEQKIVTVGKKGKQTMERLGKGLIADFSDLKESPELIDILGIGDLLMDEFLEGKIDEVSVIYNHFNSVLSQKPTVKKLLPIAGNETFKKPKHNADYIFEGDKNKLLDELLKRYVLANIYQLILESQASEQSARMMAMRKASDSAKEIVGNLTLEFNKGRQAKITTQLLEIVAGSES